MSPADLADDADKTPNPKRQNNNNHKTNLATNCLYLRNNAACGIPLCVICVICERITRKNTQSIHTNETPKSPADLADNADKTPKPRLQNCNNHTNNKLSLSAK